MRSGLLDTLRLRAGNLKSRLLGAEQSPPAIDPVNLRPRDASPGALTRDVDYAIQILLGFKAWSDGQGFDLRGKAVMELGPGINLAGALGLKALGARDVYVADRWLPPWEDHYNPAFCRAMAERMRMNNAPADPTVLERVAAAGYDGTLTLLECPAEVLASAAPVPMDAIYSNAVLEHMADHRAVAKALFAITAPGGIGFHQVDFRFHENFDRPLDQLLMTPNEHLNRCLETHYETGCQIRPAELQTIFEETGFSLNWHPNDYAKPDYFAEFIQELRSSASAYRDWPADALRETGGLYVLRK